MSNFYGLIGEKLGHSYSAEISDLFWKRLNMRGTYNLFEVRPNDLGKSINALKILGCAGSNVTIPYKIEVMNYIDEVSDVAKSIGAVNTLKFFDNKIKGYNTDYYGFGLALDKYGISLRNRRVVILGTGGVSKAVEKYMENNGVKDMIYVSRNPKKNSISNMKIISYEELKTINYRDIIVNCTPCGMYPNINSCAVDKSILSKFETAVDLIYNPENTLFLKMAKQLGLKTINGLYTLITQNLVSQNIWNDMDIPVHIADEVYNEIIQNKANL